MAGMPSVLAKSPEAKSPLGRAAILSKKPGPPHFVKADAVSRISGSVVSRRSPQVPRGNPRRGRGSPGASLRDTFTAYGGPTMEPSVSACFSIRLRRRSAISTSWVCRIPTPLKHPRPLKSYAREDLNKRPFTCHNGENGRAWRGKMRQASFAEMEHDGKKRRTRREEFLEKMEGLIPWRRLEKRIEAF